MRFAEERDKGRRILSGAIVSKVQKKRGLATSGRAADEAADEAARGRGEGHGGGSVVAYMEADSLRCCLLFVFLDNGGIFCVVLGPPYR